MSQNTSLSIVVPMHNEALGCQAFHTELLAALARLPKTRCEIIYVDDGSTDDTVEKLASIIDRTHVRVICLSRNFGKEAALSAGIAEARGAAIVMLDGDGQHPVANIPHFIAAWRAGAMVVVGVRKNNKSDTVIKRLGSRLFYRLFNIISDQKLRPGATDYRLIDRSVQRELLRLQESGRMIRSLVDWLGFSRSYIEFTAKPRIAGKASYSTRKLFMLAAQTIVSLSFKPLFLVGWLGLCITLFAGLTGALVGIEQIMLGDPYRWRFTGTAMLGLLTLFLVGIILMALGIMSVYLAAIASESKRRPLYIIDQTRSVGATNESA